MADAVSRTGNDAVKLTISKVITLLIGLVSNMLLSRFRTLTEYGTYSQLLMAVNIVCALLMLGLPNSINYFLAKAQTEEERGRFLSVYYTFSTLLSFIIGLVLVLSVPLLEKFFCNKLIKSFWYFLAFYPWTRVIMSGVENLLIVYHKTTTLIIYRILNSIVLLWIILIIQWTGGSFYQYMILLLGCEISFTVWVYVIVRQNNNKVKFSLDKKLIRTVLIFSVPIGLAAMLGTINIELDKMVITSFLSTEKLAVYTNASRELPVSIIAASLTAVLMPQVVRLLQDNRKEEAIKLWNSAASIAFAVISVIAVGCFTFAPEVIRILYSAKYIDGVSVFRVYCLTLLFRCTYFGMMLNASGNTKFILYSSIGSLAINLLLNFVCYFIFGFIGPAIATFIATLTMNIYQLFYTCKKLKIRFSAVFPWKNCGLYLIVNIALGIIFYFAKLIIIKATDINGVIAAVCLGAVWTALFAVITRKQLKKQWKYLNEER